MKGRFVAFLRGVTGAAPWRPNDRPYPVLAAVDVRELGQQSGIYALWHLGVRPRWVRIGGAADLAAAIGRVKSLPEVSLAAVHGGAYVAWAPLAIADIPAAIAGVATQTQPYLQHLELSGELRAATSAKGAFPLPPGSGMPAGG